MALIKIGTFNLNNLFSRFNFRATITEATLQTREPTTYSIASDAVTLRKYAGRLVGEKPAAERALLAQRIRAMDVDVLAVQEVEDIDTLKRFVSQELSGAYPYVVLIEANDPRLIDVGLLSRLPLGAVSSWQHATHPECGGQRVFSRDLLEVEVYDRKRKRRLFTLFNTHLKSRFLPAECKDVRAATRKANLRRRQQAETIARILEQRMRPDGKYVLLGDMNDPVSSERLAAFAKSRRLGLRNALVAPEQTRGSDRRKAWTYRFKASHGGSQYQLYDQIWLSPPLAERQREAWIDRRTRSSGDGSDHDPAWVAVHV